MKNRISCFAVAALLLALTLWFTACGSTSAEAGASSQPCYKAHRNDPKPPKLMKPLAPVSATKKQRKKAPKK